ncbi:MAG: winged helix-turn-helix transcriptional regulator [Candidatus Thermoplasmatota archaeon]|nr:winged helix-turn-helix transcriptional regulator [Candidatus Thermoplasmatota archaeon]MBS3790861.1 winged helix-turn-helix transcriptional regulator [Candidatus Thermoplasmatota archaeon]
MDKYNENDLEEAGDIFKCLGDKTRVEILLTMKDGEKCVHDISDLTDQEISNVSHHLRRLKDKRLVDYRKEGRHKYYRIDDEHVLNILEEGLEHARE